MDDATSVPTDDALANTANRLPEMKKHLLILAMLPIMSYIQSNYMSNYQVTDSQMIGIIIKTNLVHHWQPVWTSLLEQQG